MHFLQSKLIEVGGCSKAHLGLEKSSHLQKDTTEFFDGMNQCVKEEDHKSARNVCQKTTSEASKFPVRPQQSENFLFGSVR